jgi:hypothetical protein
MKCPYCGNTAQDRGFSAPEPLCSGLPVDVAERLGIQVPMIQQCLGCTATLSPAAFTPGTEKFAHALNERQAALAVPA